MNKKLYKITAIIMACALLLSICSFAILLDSSGSCYVTADYAGASTSNSEGFFCRVSLSAEFDFGSAGYEYGSDSGAGDGEASASCSASGSAFRAFASSSHESNDGWFDTDFATYGP